MGVICDSVTSNERLDFGDDPDCDADSGISQRYPYHHQSVQLYEFCPITQEFVSRFLGTVFEEEWDV